jgi:RNA polymerase sigma-70 factor (ECF subfamily)
MSQNQQRYAALIKLYHADLYRYAYWLCQHKPTAEDLVQETFLRAWKSLDSLLDAAAAKAWLITILRRENARRFERKQFEYSDVEQDELIDDAENDPEQHAATQQLQKLMNQLSIEYREPLVLQLLFGMSGDEIAVTLELNLNTVNTRLFRARQQLRDLINHQQTRGISHG